MNLDQNVRLVFSRINSAKKRSSYNQNVELIAATKTRDILQIQTCYELGISSIGENRVQEAEKTQETDKNEEDAQIEINLGESENKTEE